MEQNSIEATIEVAQSPTAVFAAITDITKWWSRDVEGRSTELNDEFSINHPGQHFSKQRLVEVVPGKKIVWLVTESQLDWLKADKEEWTATKMIFEISSRGDKTVLHFTHEGLVPEKECYDVCKKGWNLIITNWLFHFITEGKPSAEMEKAAEIRNQHLKNKAETESYHKTIIVNASPEAAQRKISQVTWWKKDFEGSAQKPGDKFTIPFGELNGEKSFVDFVVSEWVPGKKTGWKVTDCNLPWFKDKKEWNGTEVVFELLADNGKTQIAFTHIGLVPGFECYAACENGWNGHITQDLLKFIDEG